MIEMIARCAWRNTFAQIVCSICLEQLNQLACQARGRLRVCTGKEDAALLILVDDHLFGPWSALLELRTTLDQAALDQVGAFVHHLRLLLLFVAEGGHLAAFDEMLAVAQLHLVQDARGVTDSRDDPARLVKGTDELLRAAVVGKADQRTVTARVEDRSVLVRRQFDFR